MKNILLISTLLILLHPIFGQENRKENGVKVGAWAHQDERGLVYARGLYANGVKTGPWRYYVSPVSRYTQVPDVLGDYDASGQKTGRWTFVNAQVQLEVEFVNGLMDGECLHFSPEGSLLAMGQMNAGLRHGQWIFYYQGKEMAKGFYQDGVKMGEWNYDYFPERDLRIRGKFSYDNGKKSGRLEYYKISRHPKFGVQEFMSGLGLYQNGKKVGRWIEYTRGLKGELVAVGTYNNNGKRQGFWRTTINRLNYEAAFYENGVINGTYKLFHDNGALKYETTYQNGVPVGSFTRYYDNGNIEEKGTTILIPNAADIKKDTTYFELQLPYEVHFQLVEERDFEKLRYTYIDWVTDPNYSIEPAELDRRYALYVNDYGFEPQRRITNIAVNRQKAVRKGPYQAFYLNGQLKLTGNYFPRVSEVYDPIKDVTLYDYARDGEWKYLDDNGYVMRTMFYDKGKLLRQLDDKGNEVGARAPQVEDEGADGSPAPDPIDQGRPIEVKPDGGQ